MTDLLAGPLLGIATLRDEPSRKGAEVTDALWTAYRATPTADLRNQLVLQYSPLVKYVAGRVRVGLPPTVDSADLVSEGIIGLIDAIDRFEPERGLQFPTYAVPRIRGAILDSVRASDWVPRAVRSQLRTVETARSALQQRWGRTPEPQEIAAEVGMDVSELRRLLERPTHVSPAGDDLLEFDSAAPALEEALEDEGTRVMVMAAVRRMPERDQVIVALYYFESLTLAEIGQVLGVTESRVSQLRSRATLALRAELAELMLT